MPYVANTTCKLSEREILIVLNIILIVCTQFNGEWTEVPKDTGIIQEIILLYVVFL